MTTAWSHLPNAAHIDRVLADVTANPKKWSVVYDAAWYAAWDAAMGAVYNAARGAVYNAARTAAWYAAWYTAWDAAWSAVLALIAYDDCAHLLDGDPEDVKLMALLGSDAAILLYPACVALNKQMELA